MTYNLDSWRAARSSADRVVMRPSRKTLGARLAGSLIILVFAGILSGFFWSSMFDVEWDVEQAKIDAIETNEAAFDALAHELTRLGASEEELAELERERQERIAAIEARGPGGERIYAFVLWCVFGAAVLFAIVLPVSTLWQHVTISRDIRNQLVVRRRGMLMLSSRRAWPLSGFTRGSLALRQASSRTPDKSTGGRTYHTTIDGYEWCVQLHEHGTDSGEDAALEFRVHMSTFPPMPGSEMPESVSQFAEALERLTGIAIDRNVRMHQPEREAWIGEASATDPHAEAFVKQHAVVSKSLDQLPPHLREKAQSMIAEALRTGQSQTHEVTEIEGDLAGLWPGDDAASGGTTSVQQTISIQGPDGTTRTYHSVEEMPADVRAKYETVMQRLKGK